MTLQLNIKLNAILIYYCILHSTLIKACSHGHFDAHRMHIECTFNVDHLWSHKWALFQCESKSEVNWIHLQRWFGCTFKQEFIIILGSHEVTSTIRSLAWLVVCVRMRILLLHSAQLLYRHWRRKRFVFSGLRRVVQDGKRSRWFHCITLFRHKTTASASETNIRTNF